MQVIKDNQDIQDNQDNLDDQDIQDNQDNQDNLDNHDNHENHDNQDNQGNHDDQDNQAGLAHLPVNFRVIYFFLSKSYNCHLPYGKLLFSSQHARVFWYKIAKGQGFSVTNFLQLQSEKSSDKTRVWFGKFENFDFIPESRGRLSP